MSANWGFNLWERTKLIQLVRGLLRLSWQPHCQPLLTWQLLSHTSDVDSQTCNSCGVGKTGVQSFRDPLVFTLNPLKEVWSLMQEDHQIAVPRKVKDWQQ